MAAMAYGTESIAKVDKIFGPGNRYVMKAKQLVGKEGVATDMPAGPSEVLVIADESANVSYVAADLLSQAEHGPDSQVVLVSDNVTTARSVLREIENQKESLSRKGIVDAALTESRIIVMRDLDECMDFAAFHFQINIVECFNTRKFFGDAFHLQYFFTQNQYLPSSFFQTNKANGDERDALRPHAIVLY